MDSELKAFLDGKIVSIQAVARIMNVSNSTVYGWIRDGNVKNSGNGHTKAVQYDENQEFLRKHLFDRVGKAESAYVPTELERYSKWHQIVDGMTWLLKVSYSTPDEIKKRRFRLDKLFANYLRSHDVNLRTLRQALSTDTSVNRTAVTDDLKRGWYNELSFILPLKHSTLGLSFHDVEANKSKAIERFAFPSWRITMAYYSTYFYLRSIVLQKQRHLRIQEHGKAIASFKNNALGSISQTIWKFPFSIAYVPGRRFFKSQILTKCMPHLKHKYCSHPQPPRRLPSQLVEFIYQAFKAGGMKRQKPIAYTLFDYLHDFRIWANYLEIDNLLSLAGEGYKSFLDQNLSLVLFFFGGFAELSFISIFGENSYAKSLRRFFNLVVTSKALSENDLTMVPHYQRLQIYRLLGLVKINVEPRVNPDINAISLISQEISPLQ